MYTAVSKAFPSEAERAFGFLVSEYGLNGPDRQGVVLPVIAYTGSGLRYHVMLDDNITVITRVEIESGVNDLVAELADLISVTGLGSPGDVRYSAQSLRNLRQTLEVQAEHVRRLHPVLAVADATAFMRKAGAREWHREL